MNREIMRFIERQFARQARKMRNIVARGVVALVQDGLKMQGIQIKLLDGELIDGAEHPQPYGFSSHAHPGAEVFVAFCGADGAHPLVLCVDDRRYRFKGDQPGEVRMYSDEGDYIHFSRGNIVEIKTKHLVANVEEDATINTRAAVINAEDSFDIETMSFNVLAGETNIVTDTFSVSGTDGQAIDSSFSGLIKTPQDVQGAGVSLAEHPHRDVQPGGGQSGPPVAGG